MNILKAYNYNKIELYYGANSSEYMGYLGEETNSKYEDGDIIHVGDIVRIKYIDHEELNNDGIGDLSIVCNIGDNKARVMGLFSAPINNGIVYKEEIKIELVAKYKQVILEKYKEVVKYRNMFLKYKGKEYGYKR